MSAAWLLQKELDRLYSAGQVGSVRIPDPTPTKGKKKSRGKLVDVSPSHVVGTITVLAIVGGFGGAKLFHILENLDDFSANPLGMIFSKGGFTFYGGLIVGSLVVIRYARKKGVSVPRLIDAAAPGLMLAYGIGRIGCHLSGDGDWGITSSLASKPAWLPTWLWSETYPNNILGLDLSAAPVYPTPLYEFAAAVLLFFVLYKMRAHRHVAGWLFWTYLALNGLERFFIEKIRVNNQFELFGVSMTQAEIIAIVLMIAGVLGMWKTWPSQSAPASVAAAAASSEGPNREPADE
jgi:phosphatidylglycerol:prolipoprotein diacylglycerol transferase